MLVGSNSFPSHFQDLGCASYRLAPMLDTDDLSRLVWNPYPRNKGMPTEVFWLKEESERPPMLLMPIPIPLIPLNLESWDRVKILKIPPRFDASQDEARASREVRS